MKRSEKNINNVHFLFFIVVKSSVHTSYFIPVFKYSPPFDITCYYSDITTVDMPLCIVAIRCWQHWCILH